MTQDNGVIRSTTLLLVLTLTGVPGATVLCIGWCDAEAASGATAATCHHGTTSAGMPGIRATEHGCDARLQAEPFVREDVQRIASGSTTDHAVLTADHFRVLPTLEGVLGTPPNDVVRGERAACSTILRI